MRRGGDADGRNAWEVAFTCRCGRRIERQKNRERGDAPALDGCFLTVQHNNQITWRRRWGLRRRGDEDGRNVWGLAFTRRCSRRIERQKIRDTGGPFPLMATNWRNYTTINIQSTREGGGAMERICDRGEACGMTPWRRFSRRIYRENSKRKTRRGLKRQ